MSINDEKGVNIKLGDENDDDAATVNIGVFSRWNKKFLKMLKDTWKSQPKKGKNE